MTAVWMLSVNAPENEAYKIAETLGFLEESEALAVSVYESNETYIVEALYDAKTGAKTAHTIVGGNIVALDDKDWVSATQSGLPPVEAGRFFVHGSHDADKIPEDISHPILIDAGMAFGTGHHGTTKGCLVIFDNLLTNGHRPNSVLDLGCGAGILAIAAAKALPTIKIVASDIDQDAIHVTKENATLNDVAHHINAIIADGLNSDDLRDQEFDLIFANILAGPLMGLAPDIFRVSAPKGFVILSGILNEQAETVAATFETEGFTILSQTSLGEWTSLLARRL